MMMELRSTINSYNARKWGIKDGERNSSWNRW
jgi:hypothetical protein